MPYISNEERVLLNPQILYLINEITAIENKKDDVDDSFDVRDHDGRLNYCITEILLNILELDNDPRYTKLNTALGVLEGVKLELYRRLGGPYEDEAIKKNGDIGVFKRFNKLLSAKKEDEQL